MEMVPDEVWEGLETAEWCVRRLLQLHFMPAQFYAEARTEKEGGVFAEVVFEAPLVAVAVLGLFLAGNLLRSTALAVLAWALSAAGPQRERVRAEAWGLCWHALAAAMALEGKYPVGAPHLPAPSWHTLTRLPRCAQPCSQCAPPPTTRTTCRSPTAPAGHTARPQATSTAMASPR